ncbi:SPOSA6832_01385 [Sporobolomyces salmonicolor]|uniref:SPOSA6832_01385-mRNA-1:cds n=1 Tax=Sporidiobolus salmonicolor TaxID=5005 RepID=A0A0D6EIG2_SPOSA|nr:SPOSA6832_01385 [Sporobolomyces salmonicolor]
MDASPSHDLTLGQLLSRAIRNASSIQEAPAPNDQAIQVSTRSRPSFPTSADPRTPAQTLLQNTLSDLSLSSSLINHLGVLSPNETLDDINTADLRCLLVEALRGQLCLLARTKGGRERVDYLVKAQEHFRKYAAQIEQYEVVAADKRSVFAGPAASEMDANKRRAGKIAQFKMEREIKGTLEELRKRRRERRPRPAVLTSASASTSTSATPAEPDDDNDFLSDDDDESESVARPLLINLLQLHYLRAFAELSSVEQELELLEHGMKMSEIPSPSPHAGPSTSSSDSRARKTDEEDTTWRLDKLAEKDGPVLSPDGKVLRPFVILPSTSSSSSPLSTRLRLQSEVFRPSHRLPTMTIDEYLEQQQEMGNVLQGGGPSTSDEVDQARRDEQGEKEDDTLRGYEAEEAGLKKIREWDEYTDTHRKGEGNMHNRG